MRMTVDFGIDLGTSNSAIAVADGAKSRLLCGSDGQVLLPSAVRVLSDGAVKIGFNSYASRGTDPANTAVEFKRQMGSPETILFPASGKSYTPIQLSAFVLRVLAKRAEAIDGQPLRAAVITIPAMFQLSQCEATRKAAALAGIEHAPLLQEPIAAAIAHAGAGFTKEGHWLVYDLGGGTFDVSLVRSRGGRLQVLDHDGDNHLGGKDFNRLLARQMADVIRDDGQLGEFRRTDPHLAGAFARLTAEAERVRIRLSEVEQELFSVEDLGTSRNGQRVGISVPIDRELLESLISPSILRTTALCKTLLDRNRLRASELKGIVLVGGPTWTPCLTDVIERELGLPARHEMDPTTIVASGAAIFAATQKLPATLRSTESLLDLEFESMTTNPRPLLVGRINDLRRSAGYFVQIRRDDGNYDSGLIAVDKQGAFTAPLALRSGELNVFDVILSSDAMSTPIGPSTRFSILHGLSVSKPPLSQSVGVMLADNSVRWYLRKGQVLPAENTVTQTTTLKLLRGQSGDAIRVPLVQGESERADRNLVIGVLCIHADGIASDLPVGTDVQITLTVDEFSRTTARGYVPLLGQSFDQLVRFDAKVKDATQVSAGLEGQLDRLRQLELEADQLAVDGGENLDSRISELEDLISEGDRDSVDLADQMLRMMTRQIDNAEATTHVDALRDKFNNQLRWAEYVVKDSKQNRELNLLANEFQSALDRGDNEAAESKFATARNIVFNARVQTIQFWKDMLKWLYERFDSLGMLQLFEQQMREGIAAAEADDLDKLVKVCNELLGLLPQEDRKEFQSVVSNVM